MREPPIRTTSSEHDVPPLCRTVLSSLDDDKAEDIVTINLAGKCSFADYMIVASGRSQRHVGSLAQNLRDTLKKSGIDAAIEGMEQCDWVLIDAGDVIVHIFRPETRGHYNLEKMWALPTPTRETAIST